MNTLEITLDLCKREGDSPHIVCRVGEGSHPRVRAVVTDHRVPMDVEGCAASFEYLTTAGEAGEVACEVSGSAVEFEIPGFEKPGRSVVAYVSLECESFAATTQDINIEVVA